MSAVWQPVAEIAIARVATVRDPFLQSLAAEDFGPVLDGTTLQDLAPVDAGAWTCQVDDRFVLREHWHYAVPPGAMVVFRELAQGGNGGKQSLRILLTIALISFTGSFTLSAAAQAAAVALGGLAINALIPLDATNFANNSGGGAQQFSGQVQQNMSRIGQPMPEIFGFDHGWPDLATQAYATYAGNEQYVHCILCVGQGQYQIDQVYVGDTPITSYSEAQVARLGNAQNALSGPGIWADEPGSQFLVEPLMHVVDEVQGVDMTTLDHAGPYPICRPERTATTVCIDIALPLGLDGGRSIAWRVEVQDIDDFGAATGAWVVLASETYNTASAEPVRMSYSYALPTTTRKQCRLVRTDTRSTDDGSRHDISWLGLRSILTAGTTSELLPDVAGNYLATFIFIKIRISGQLSGVLRFRVKCRRMLPTWNGSVWSVPVLTRNPAWAIARVLQARGVPDAQIDLDTLLTLSQTWDARQDRFDYRFDSQMTTWDALAMIARVGNAVPLIRGSKYTFARDQPQASPVAMFGMRNIRRGSFSLAFAFPESDPMTALDLEYWDHRRWGNVTVTAQLHNGVIYGYRGELERTALGIPAPATLARGSLRMPGVIGEQHAIRIVVRMLAEGLYRRMVASYSTALDGLLPAPLQLVLLQHDVGRFGQAGDVALWTEGTLTVGTTEPLAWEPGANHYVRLMRPDGRLSASIAVLPGATDHDMVLASDPGFTPLFDDASRERTRYVFGPADRMGALAKLRAIVPRSANEIEHRVVLEDDRVHTADNAWLPGGSEQDPLNSTGGYVFFDGGMSGAPVPDDGGGLVYLTGGGIGSTYANGATYNPAYTLRVYNDGRLSMQHQLIAEAFQAPQWFTSQTVTAAIAGLYEVRFTDASAEVGLDTGYSAFPLDTFGGAALDTWLSLDTTRTVTMTHSIGMTNISAAKVLVEIRDVATGTVQGSGGFIFHDTMTFGS